MFEGSEFTLLAELISRDTWGALAKVDAAAIRRRHGTARRSADVRYWPAGPTAICNVCSYCRTHHRLKHQAPGWTRHFQADGTLTIRTPTGITRTTWPEPDRALRAAQPDAIDRGNASSQRLSTPAQTLDDQDPPPY